MSSIDGPKNKAFVSLGVLSVIAAALFIRLWQIQVMDHPTYYRLAQINSAQSMSLLAPRGLIYDRNGNVLVNNKAVFSVYILQSELKDRKKTLQLLAPLVSMKPEAIDSIISAKKIRPFDPILIKAGIPVDVVSRIEEQVNNLKGVVVNVVPVRVYPNKSIAAHVLGYVGEVTAKDVEANLYSDIRPGDLIGKAGIEKIYDAYLRGVNGGEKITIDIIDSEETRKNMEESVPGKNMYLTVDIELQKAVESALGGNSGTVVVLDPSNGEVLALASHPSYDPNIFARQITPSEWKELNSEKHPFLNRALSVYPPGSIFKVVTLSAALERNLFTPENGFACRGFFRLGSRIARCWKASGHGHIKLLEGLVQSCDVVFYNVGLKVGPDVISEFARKYGLGEKTGIDLPTESTGLVPTTGWKKERFGENWYPGDTINYAIGQGFLWVTPMQMANIYAAIANGKDRYEPHLIKMINDREGGEIFTYVPKVVGGIPVSDKNLKYIKDSLHSVVHRATGIGARIASFEAAGKTGTAENPKNRPHAWFICYAPWDKPRIVVASFVEYGLHGDQVTARIAHSVLDWYHRYRVLPKPKAAGVVKEEDTEVISPESPGE